MQCSPSGIMGKITFETMKKFEGDFNIIQQASKASVKEWLPLHRMPTLAEFELFAPLR